MAHLRGDAKLHPSRRVKVTDAILARLESGGLEQLTTLAIDHLLSVPLATLVNPEVLASQIAINWRHTARSEQSQKWVRAHVEAAAFSDTNRPTSGSHRTRPDRTASGRDQQARRPQPSAGG